MQAPDTETFAPPSQVRARHLPDTSTNEARARVQAALRAEGFSVVAVLDLADLLSRRVDAHFTPHYIVEACHPVLTQRALAVAPEGGLLTPLRVSIWQEGTGARIASMQPVRVVAAIGRPRLAEVALALGERLDRVFERLDDTTAAAPDTTDAGPDDLGLGAADRLFLREALRSHIQELLAEVAGTESRPLQHQLAEAIDRLDVIVRKLGEFG